VRSVYLHDLDRGAQHVGQVEDSLLELELTRLDLRDVEDVIDEIHQVLRRHHGVLPRLG
tara:strand:- start:232 stop:408 length:177 start_codon:yes stop_codon:yes gene_type:complete